MKRMAKTETKECYQLIEGQKISFTEIIATQRYTRPSSRYTEASLGKKT